MKAINLVLKFIYSIYAFLIFLVVMLILFPFVILASFFGSITGGNIIASICRIWADVCMFFWVMPHTNINVNLKERKHAVIFVFNHISYIDIPIILKTFRNEPIRILAKAELGKVPIFGYIYRRATVMVDRQSEAARVESVRRMKFILSKNISVVIAPEGTFNTTHKPLKDFYNGAFKIAVETNTPIQPVVFLDAYDRLHYKSVFSMCPGKSRAVFLPEVLPGNDVDVLKQQVCNVMEETLVEYKASWIFHNE